MVGKSPSRKKRKNLKQLQTYLRLLKRVSKLRASHLNKEKASESTQHLADIASFLLSLTPFEFIFNESIV
jgi:hypothetical protein